MPAEALAGNSRKTPCKCGRQGSVPHSASGAVRPCSGYQQTPQNAGGAFRTMLTKKANDRNSEQVKCTGDDPEVVRRSRVRRRAVGPSHARDNDLSDAAHSGDFRRARIERRPNCSRRT